MTITDRPAPTMEQMWTALDTITGGYSYGTVQRLRTAIRNLLDVARARDDARQRHARDSAAFDAMDPCSHTGPQSYCGRCFLESDLKAQERHLDRLDLLLERSSR